MALKVLDCLVSSLLHKGLIHIGHFLYEPANLQKVKAMIRGHMQTEGPDKADAAPAKRWAYMIVHNSVSGTLLPPELPV